MIYAVVRGSVGKYNTSVNIADFAKSECDCPYEDYCKHMVAVVYAAANLEKSTVSNEEQVPTPDSVMALLSTLPHNHLLEVIDLSLQDKPKLAQHVSVSFSRWQTRQDMKRALVGMDTPEAIRYFERRVSTVVMEAEQMFQSGAWDDGEEEYNSWGDPVYSKDTWHCQEGITHVRHWCETLLEAITDKTAVAVVVGLTLTVSKVASWHRIFPREAERELSQGLYECSKVLEEAIKGLQAAIARNGELRQSYFLFTDWIADQCKNMGYLVDWTEVLSVCILDGTHLRRFHEKLLLNNPVFLLSEELLDSNERGVKEYNGYGQYLVDWWCRLCLLHGDIEEAEKAIQPSTTEGIPVASVTTLRTFANYFVRHEELRKAAYYTGLAVRANPHASAKDYEWVAEMYKSTDMLPEFIQAREQAFLSAPTWERFHLWIREISSAEEQQNKVKNWASVLARKGQMGLACRMFWTVGLVEVAWSTIRKQKLAEYMIDENLVQFLKDYQTYNASRSVQVYIDFSNIYISHRKRSSYRQATEWLRAARDAWHGSNQWDEWKQYITTLRNEYRQLPALLDELRKAGLVEE